MLKCILGALICNGSAIGLMNKLECKERTQKGFLFQILHLNMGWTFKYGLGSEVWADLFHWKYLGNWGQMDLSVSLSEKMAPTNRFVFQIWHLNVLGAEHLYGDLALNRFISPKNIYVIGVLWKLRLPYFKWGMRFSHDLQLPKYFCEKKHVWRQVYAKMLSSSYM